MVTAWMQLMTGTLLTLSPSSHFQAGSTKIIAYLGSHFSLHLCLSPVDVT